MTCLRVLPGATLHCVRSAMWLAVPCQLLHTPNACTGCNDVLDALLVRRVNQHTVPSIGLLALAASILLRIEVVPALDE